MMQQFEAGWRYRIWRRLEVGVDYKRGAQEVCRSYQRTRPLISQSMKPSITMVEDGIQAGSAENQMRQQISDGLNAAR